MFDRGICLYIDRVMLEVKGLASYFNLKVLLVYRYHCNHFSASRRICV